jgi:hypothetical protein
MSYTNMGIENFRMAVVQIAMGCDPRWVEDEFECSDNVPDRSYYDDDATFKTVLASWNREFKTYDTLFKSFVQMWPHVSDQKKMNLKAVCKYLVDNVDEFKNPVFDKKVGERMFNVVRKIVE